MFYYKLKYCYSKCEYIYEIVFRFRVYVPVHHVPIIVSSSVDGVSPDPRITINLGGLAFNKVQRHSYVIYTSTYCTIPNIYILHCYVNLYNFLLDAMLH